MVARAGLYEYFKQRLFSFFGMLQGIFVMFYAYKCYMDDVDDGIQDFTLFNSLTSLFIFSIIFSLPAASVYSSQLYSILLNKDGKLQHHQKEAAVNLMLIMMDMGSVMANILTAYILLVYYPNVAENPPG